MTLIGSDYPSIFANYYLSCFITSWTKKLHDIVDSIVEQMFHDIVDSFAQYPINTS